MDLAEAQDRMNELNHERLELESRIALLQTELSELTKRLRAISDPERRSKQILGQCLGRAADAGLEDEVEEVIEYLHLKGIEVL